MLRFITHKLRNQSLNEVRPLEGQGAWRTENFDEKESFIWGESSRDLSTLTERDYGNGNNNIYPNFDDGAAIEPQLKELRPEKYLENGIYNIALSPKLEIYPEQSHKEKEIGEGSKDDLKENVPCFLPILEISGRRYPPVSERRKLHDVKRRKAESNSDSSSSDDEIKELCSHNTSKFKLSSSRPPDKIAAVSSSFIICQRRRNRGTSPRFPTNPRPSINFDKMQQTIMLRRQRNRVVRVKNLPSVHSGTRPFDPSLLGFKPIASLNPCINHLAPVEDPLAF